VVAVLERPGQEPMKTKELARALGVDAAGYRDFRRLLAELERSGAIGRVRGQRYAVAPKADVVTGSVSVTRDGHGFVRPEGDAGSDVYVPARSLESAMDGDRVVVRIDRHARGRNREGHVLRILERGRETLVGTLHRGGKVAYVTPLDPRFRRDVMLAPGQAGAAEEGDVVVVRLSSYGDGHVGPVGDVVQVLGALGDPGVDVLAVAHGFGLALDFSPEVEAAAKEAATLGWSDPGPDRVDRTDLLTFTIDPADAKDHDDALSVTERPDGVLEVGVHIADVAHFVRPGTRVDVEAAARGTSVYLVDRTIPMLPKILSNDACSLQPGAPRFAVSVFVTLDGEGRVTERRYERTSIVCRYGLAYEEAQDVLDGRTSLGPEVDRALRLLDDRARHLRRMRRERGALDLDVPEAKVVLDDEGRPVDIVRRDRRESHRLIEDYMILANEVVARDLETLDLGTMYRVHERPAREKVEALADTLSRLGLHVPRRQSVKPRDLQRILDAVRGRELEAMVSSLVLRSLAKARYDVENVGHFGLASDAYLHFTSPIRRYPDLVVHRILTAALVHRAPTPYAELDELARSAERCSASERAAEEAERASVAMKKVEFMEQHLGESFTGRVSGVTGFGFFVTLEEVFVDGLVHISSLDDDYYLYRERDHVLVGERGRGSWRLGDRVEVQVSRVDREARQVDFVVIQKLAPGPGRTSPSGGRSGRPTPSRRIDHAGPDR
jgi:ribonuclease R